MKAKQYIGCAMSIITLCISMPIWYWLLYQILTRVGATDLMWFLYWVYVPVGFVMGIVGKVVEYAFTELEKDS
jgi:hypothetical protein